MHAASREAFERLTQTLDQGLSESDNAVGTGAITGTELFDVVDVLDGERSLRVALVDAAVAPEQRVGIVKALLSGKVTASTEEIVSAAVSQNWSTSQDLRTGLERLGRRALLRSAEAQGQLGRVEGELFSLARILENEPELELLLSDRAAATNDRRDLLAKVIYGKVSSVTEALALQAIGRARKAPVDLLDELCQESASLNGFEVARVRSAAPLSEEQRDSLSAKLEKIYGRKIAVHAEVDSSLLGGAVVRVGDEVIDGSTAGKLERLRRSLALGKTKAEQNLLEHETESRKNMAELTISSDEIRSAIANYTSSYSPEASREEVGVVTTAADGIANVSGMPSVMANELLEFPGGVIGVAQNLDTDSVGVVVLGNYESLKEGDEVKRTGEVLSIPVGENFLGRVINPLGEPIDGLGEITDTEERALELQAPSVLMRQPVSEPMQTGIKAIDAMTPIGRGQRQLIIGDRKTGKTSVCIDTILNQRENWESGDPKKQVRCIYVAIGQKGSTIASIRQTLEEHGALEYTTIVASPASDSAGFKWLAPFAGAALGQHWMYQGKHVLVIYDDLTKQAEAYRAISLLLRRPPGREAYPGDVFYLHSRLLERAAKLNDELGGGSLTALPIIETKANDVSAFIPTNVISITDGQVFLESDLFNQGIRPAINVGVSVSRVGGDAQTKGMKKVSGNLRLDLAAYRDLEAFSAFASDLDDASKAQLERGERLVELLKQTEHAPQSVEHQMISIWLAGDGEFDDVPVEDVRRFESELLDHLHANEAGIFEQIAGGTPFTAETQAQLKQATNEFKRGFQTTDGTPIIREPEARAMEQDEVQKSEITVTRKTV